MILVLAAVKRDDIEKVTDNGSCQTVALTDVLKQDHLLLEKKYPQSKEPKC